MNTSTRLLTHFALLAVLSVSTIASPRLLVLGENHAELVNKVESVEWARAAFEKLRSEIDFYVSKVDEEPDWVTSRFAMNWDTHYERTITEGSRSVGGEGRAPVPTPRFEGARDWKTDYGWQKPIENLKPYNDRNGEILLVNLHSGEEAWVSPSVTGHTITRINEQIMKLAADAAFIYWVTGDEKYADFAAPILWTYMEGFSYVKPPFVSEKDQGARRIIGSATYEVIHDGILHNIAIAYDFLRDYLKERDDIDGNVVERGIKTFVDRIVAGGGRQGNWNLHQAMKIAYGGLVLESNDHYEDGKGREYYVDIVLNADLPQQLGLMHVIRQGYDQETAIWPEAPGYAFSTTGNIVEIASLLSNDPNGRKVLEDPVVAKAVLDQVKQTYPNGRSHGLGDTSYKRIDTTAAELMTSWYVGEGDLEAAGAFSAMLQREIEDGAYSRDEETSLVALTRFLAELPPANFDALEQTPTYFAKPIDLVMLRNMPHSGDKSQALAASMFGTKGGHMHTNGLAIELFGAGQVLGVDSGRGSSYWQKDHGEYYRTLPSHNTVIPKGNAGYPSHGEGTIAMEVLKVYPAFGEVPTENALTYLTSGFDYLTPSATQHRTLALVRIDEETAFFFDVMRSKLNEKDPEEYHDWLYHAMADSADLGSLELEKSALLTSEAGNMKGYDYFKNESSIVTEADLHARFPFEMEGSKVAMDVWVLGGSGRQLFLVDAPANRAARHNMDEKYWDRLIPMLLVRQQGEAWNRPFVALYEPYAQSEGAKVVSFESTGENSWIVSGNRWNAFLVLDGPELEVRIEKSHP